MDTIYRHTADSFGLSLERLPGFGYVFRVLFSVFFVNLVRTCQVVVDFSFGQLHTKRKILHSSRPPNIVVRKENPIFSTLTSSGEDGKLRATSFGSLKAGLADEYSDLDVSLSFGSRSEDEYHHNMIQELVEVFSLAIAR